jgi:anthranilate synthase component 2
MKILLLDNYDSFTYNIAHYLRELTGHEIPVRRNDQVSLEEIEAYDAIVLSPGPGLPADAGIMHDLIRKFAPTKKIFGICLGMQAIGEVFGGTLLNLPSVFHGVATPATVLIRDEQIFKGVPDRFEAGRYHSWVVDEKTLPRSLEITAIDDTGRIMALRHKIFDVRGVQFHPESVLTPHGKTMILNWLNLQPATSNQQLL